MRHPIHILAIYGIFFDKKEITERLKHLSKLIKNKNETKEKDLFIAIRDKDVVHRFRDQNLSS